MVILLTGTNSYRMHERMRFLRSAFEKKFSAQNPRIVSIIGSEITPELLHTETHTLGLFAQKVCIIISHAEDVPVHFREHIEKLLRTTPEDVIIIITYAAPKKSPWKTLRNTAHKIEECAELSDSALRTWVTQLAQKHNVTLGASQKEQLIAGTEKNMWDIAHIIHQLKHIDAAHRAQTLPLYIPRVENSTVFTILDGISEKNLGKAIRALNEQLSQNDSIHGLITLIAKHVGLLYHVKATPRDPHDAHPFAMQKATKAATRFSLAELRDLLRALLDIDTKLKSTTLDERALLSIFLVQACKK